MKKKTPGRWKCLEASQHSRGIAAGSVVTSQVPDPVVPPMDDKNAALNDLSTSLDSMNMKSSAVSNDITITSQEKLATKDVPVSDNIREEELNWQYPSHQKSSNSTSHRSQSPTSSSSGDNQSICPIHGTRHSPTPMTSKGSTTQHSPSSGDNQSICPIHGTSHSPTPMSPKGSATQHSPSSGGQCPIHGTSLSPTTQTSSGGYTKYGPTTSKHTHNSMLAVGLETTDPLFRVMQLSRPSLTGLCNLGNSCFMNSILQCLSNTQPVRDYFVNGRHLADINRDNPLGFKGELAKAFSFLIRKLWSGEYEYFAPKKLLSVVASRSSHFGDNEQHDSHEFMSYLLDGLHEDLNRIKKKPLTPSVESDGRPDPEVAKEAWKVYKMRNDSFFVDLFQGLFKSTLVCAVCSKVRAPLHYGRLDPLPSLPFVSCVQFYL